MRVLEAITPSRIGGAEVAVARWCELLPQMGVDVELFCPKGRPFLDYALDRNIPSIAWKTHGKFDPATVIRLAGRIKKIGADLIHTHLSTASLLGGFAARLAGVPSVAHVHGFNSATCFRYSTLVVAVSEAVKKHIAAQGINVERIEVVHNGVDLERLTPIPVEEAKGRLDYTSDSPTFGVFGRLSPEKGQMVALEAMAKLLETHPKAQLIIAGRGKDETGLKAAATDLGILGRVWFTGFIEDVAPLMSACDAVIVPSLKEGFGLAAVEAMALERPVVASELGGLMEVVAGGETGFLVDPISPESFARAMRLLIEDGSLARKMGKLGRERVEDCFDLKKQTKKLVSALEDVL